MTVNPPRLVSGLVDAADGMLDGVAESTFTTIITAAGTTTAAMATLALVLLGVNIIVQYRPFHPGQVLVVAIKLVAIAWIGLKWNQFSAIAGAVETAMNTIGAVILGGFDGTGGGTGGGTVQATLATSIDAFISRFSAASGKALEPLSYYTGALMSILVMVLLSIIGGMVGLALIFAKVMVTVYLSLAPVFIALWIFDATKDYFHRWLQSTVTYMLYPLVIATVLGGIIRLVSKYLTDISANPGASVAEFIPFITALLIMVVVVAFIPYIVNSLAGSLSAPGPGAAALAARQMVSNTRGAANFMFSSERRAQSGERTRVQAGPRDTNATGTGAKSLAARIAERSARF
jgi:type IV secretion system protein VirB6